MQVGGLSSTIRGWEQAHQRKEDSTLQILRNTGNILFGKMNRMGEAIELAFSKKKIEEWKSWLRQFEPSTHLDQTGKLIKYSDFVNKELILFSMADLQRSIPSMVDSLKPSQRKILFCSFKRNFIKEAKVAQFSGYVFEHSAYHHGEKSLASTIIRMAQDYVGSNNINLLQPNGQFGTCNYVGKDHASARYMPIMPTVLVNGSEGIGTCWSSYVPNYNPRDITANIRCLLNGDAMEPMDPWYKWFKGTIEKTAAMEEGNSYTICGTIEEVNETTLRITELPICRWTQDYKEFLESISSSNKECKDTFIEDLEFDVFLTPKNFIRVTQEGLLKKFKLTTTISTTNMHLFDPRGVIKKYDNPEQKISSEQT